jgi:hypothetical protein
MNIQILWSSRYILLVHLFILKLLPNKFGKLFC